MRSLQGYSSSVQLSAAAQVIFSPIVSGVSTKIDWRSHSTEESERLPVITEQPSYCSTLQSALGVQCPPPIHTPRIDPASCTRCQ